VSKGKKVRKDGKACQTLESNPEKKSGRGANGRFLPGVAANPKGRPPMTVEQKAVRALAEVEREANVLELVRLRDNSLDDWVRIECIKLLLQYSDGKPVTAHVGAPLVALQFNNSGAPITDAHAASQVYEQIMRDPSFDLSTVKFAANPAPALIEQRPKEAK
jgi:HEAT repeat protein